MCLPRPPSCNELPRCRHLSLSSCPASSFAARPSDLILNSIWHVRPSRTLCTVVPEAWSCRDFLYFRFDAYSVLALSSLRAPRFAVRHIHPLAVFPDKVSLLLQRHPSHEHLRLFRCGPLLGGPKLHLLGCPRLHLTEERNKENYISRLI